MWFIQYTEDMADERTAKALLETLKCQIDYRGGRTLPPASQVGKTSWRVQAFFQDAPGTTGAGINWLPDGCRRVYVPQTLRGALGIIGEWVRA